MMCDNCMASYKMGNMGDHSPGNRCPLVGHLGCSQPLAIINSTKMNTWELNNLIPRILMLLMVDVFKM